MNAFLIFARRRRPQVSFGQTGRLMSTGDVSKILAREWRSMPAPEKQFYLDCEKELKKKFQSQYPDYDYRRSSRRSKRPAAKTNGGEVHAFHCQGGSSAQDERIRCHNSLNNDYGMSETLAGYQNSEQESYGYPLRSSPSCLSLNHDEFYSNSDPEPIWSLPTSRGLNSPAPSISFGGDWHQYPHQPRRGPSSTASIESSQDGSCEFKPPTSAPLPKFDSHLSNLNAELVDPLPYLLTNWILNSSG
ncbi:hypothetical protein BDP27DRAFT_414112 [Rhodocollybia butyracea]|uniref:HMG box domain-containing protein n=1 Tax=Rhodocollybia butyracea TaxID=206335 RepID=A0A9P5PZV1_9AGAR|nr:hypothetical protein BDP27DRAFT_414112 [Rhodocollybia butyracea]